MAKLGYEFDPSFGAESPARKEIVRNAELKLTHWALPPASFTSDGLAEHHLAVQMSPGIYFNQRFEGRIHKGWMPAGSSWVVPSGASGSSTWNKPNELFVLSLAPNLWNRILQDENGGAPIELTPRLIGCDPFIANVVHLMARSTTETQPFLSLLQDGLTVSLVAYLARQNAARAWTKPTTGLAHWQLQRVVDLIEDRLGEDVSLAVLAAATGLSERYFCTTFKATTGKTPYRFLIERRITRAKTLLKSENALSITEIAMIVGFRTSAHFATTFRNLTGLTPSSYRSSQG